VDRYGVVDLFAVNLLSLFVLSSVRLWYG